MIMSVTNGSEVCIMRKYTVHPLQPNIQYYTFP